MHLLRCEVYENGRLIKARTLPNRNVLDVMVRRETARGRRVVAMYPRCPGERAS